MSFDLFSHLRRRGDDLGPGRGMLPPFASSGVSVRPTREVADDSHEPRALRRPSPGWLLEGGEARLLHDVVRGVRVCEQARSQRSHTCSVGNEVVRLDTGSQGWPPQVNARDQAIGFARSLWFNRDGVTGLQQQLGHAELATTQIYASALSARRRAAVMALEFEVPAAALPANHA